MKNILLLCCLCSFQAFAYEKHCENENATVIARLEKELDDCKGNYDVVSSEALIQAHRASARCMIDVADKLFDNFYVKNNKQVKAHFKNLTKSIYDYFTIICWQVILPPRIIWPQCIVKALKRKQLII